MQPPQNGEECTVFNQKQQFWVFIPFGAILDQDTPWSKNGNVCKNKAQEVKIIIYRERATLDISEP